MSWWLMRKYKYLTFICLELDQILGTPFEDDIQSHLTFKAYLTAISYDSFKGIIIPSQKTMDVGAEEYCD